MTSPTADDALREILAAGRQRAATTDAEGVRLWDTLTDASLGGKRFRPALLTATHEALGGKQPAAAAHVGAAVELLHTAFVIHDDVIDGDDLRRGRPNVSGTYRAAALRGGASPAEADEVSRAAAILAGDLALATAIRAVASCGATTPVIGRILNLFDAAIHTTALGELTDVQLSVRPAPALLTECLIMAERKTSAYSFALPLTAGAVLANADDHTVMCLEKTGRELGLAFQLADDLTGVFCDPAQAGKSTANDLRSRKQTPLIAHAATQPQWPRLRHYLGRHLTTVELDRARSLLIESGSRAFVEGLIEEHRERAQRILGNLNLPLVLADTALHRPAAPR